MDKDTGLEGCEVRCPSFETDDYPFCPLPPEEQKVCKQRLHYEAGMKEVAAYCNSFFITQRDRCGVSIDCVQVVSFLCRWNIKLKEWGID